MRTIYHFKDKEGIDNQLAHDAHITGRVSELKAITALIANGYEVAEPVVAEPYDLLIRKEGKSNTYRVQVKTCRVREDREAVVVHAKRGNGEPYTTEDCDYLIGLECHGVGEYWAQSDRIKWKRLQ